MTKINGIIIDPVNLRKFHGEIVIQKGKILSVTETTNSTARSGQSPQSGDSVSKGTYGQSEPSDLYILPGFVDSHIHIESSMLVPSEFARLAVRHGTVATVSDPHEIANVCGLAGVEFMINNSRKVPLKFHFGAPSCVPATIFETAGAVLTVDDVRTILERDDIYFLAEMMNWPGVLSGDPDVAAKIRAAYENGKPVDGHAPGLHGEQAQKYAEAGITTDHECFSRQEAFEKMKYGMKVIIREGSAAKNYESLIDLMQDHAADIMFCSDDKHPDDLITGHINEMVSRALKRGIDFFDVLFSACVHPVRHYGMNVGLLQPGDPADFIIVDKLDDMHVVQTWIDGKCVYDGEVRFDKVRVKPINNFTAYRLTPSDFRLVLPGDPDEHENRSVPVIEALDGELITRRLNVQLPQADNELLSDPDRDILKIAVVNRYKESKPGLGFIKNFGLKNGAIASSVGHDSHNIIAVGSSDQALSRVVNLIMDVKGGMAAVHGDREEILPLPIGGIMTDRGGEETGLLYQKLNRMAREMGSTLNAPFMLISFMALLVIPSIKMSDKGLFDAEKFEFIDF